MIPAKDISVQELAAWRNDPERSGEFVVLDVREPHELEIASLPDTIRIPMRQIPERLPELSRDITTVVCCHHGIRSAQVCAFLATQGFEHAVNLTGGIDAWSLEVDPNVPRY